MATRLKVTLLAEQKTTHFIVRHLQIDDLSSPGTSRVVVQLQFTSWPHHGVSEHCLPLLQVKPGIGFTFWSTTLFIIIIIIIIIIIVGRKVMENDWSLKVMEFHQ